MKIAIAGTGYVGFSLEVLLARKNIVTAVDVVAEKVNLINQKKSPIQDKEIEEYLSNRKLNLTATLDAESAYRDAEYVIVATPTNIFADIKDWIYQAEREKICQIIVNLYGKYDYSCNAIL